ncbi:hypothetical protein, partial [Paenibacillus xylanexedens]|uniref:glycoside hydrolase family 38 N-terminal domain-containing protein n=1 Tax=Paenibacillus xylanexedens TaxID=528191 RepID=UPI0034D972C2
MSLHPYLNLPTPHSFLPHILYPHNFYHPHFPKPSNIHSLPHTFPYSPSFPHIFNHPNLQYFITTKLRCNHT